MPTQYKYKAIDNNGSSIKGLMTADDSSQVAEYLSEHELIPINIQSIKERPSFSLKKLFKKNNYEDLIVFTSNLATMYRAGIPLLRALSIIKIGPDNSSFNKAIREIRLNIQEGKSLSQAMADYQDIFPRVYINSIAAGEESGKLEDILDELITMLEKEMEITRLIKSGLRYPIIVLGVIGLAVIVLMSYVIPKFIDFYASFNAQLPLPTRIIIKTSTFFTNYWWVLIILVVVIGFAIKKILSTEKGKLFFDRLFLKLPIFGNLIIKGNIARFSLMFKILFKSGLPIIKSLEILRYSVKNSVISLEIEKLEELFRKGSESDITQEHFEFFPDLSRQMMSIGLESGSLEKMLQEVGNHYSKEVHYISKHLTAILEPILTIIIGVFVLILALAIFLPMWNLIKVFNAG